jgi:WD40 repeat protein
MCYAQKSSPSLADLLQLAESAEDVGGRTGKLGALTWHLLQEAAAQMRGPVPEWNRRANRGHPSAVVGAVFSPDGRHLASVDLGRVGTLRVWDVATGELVLEIPGLRGARYLAGLAFAPEGRRLAGVCEDQTVRVWDFPSGTLLFSLKGHSGPVHTVVFSPDGKRLATGGPDGVIKLWEATGGKEVFSLQGPLGNLFRLAFREDGTRLLAGGGDGTLIAWEANPLPEGGSST